MQEELQKEDLLYSEEGCRVYRTSDGEHVVWEWEAEPVCRLVHAIHTTLRRHALGSSYVGPFGLCGVLARGLTPLPISVTVTAKPTAVSAEYRSVDGQRLTRQEAEALPGVGPGKMAVVEDTALHTARTLRAYLSPAGITDLTLVLGFGMAATGECQMQVVNPLRCAFGSLDFDTLYGYLGGEKS